MLKNLSLTMMSAALAVGVFTASQYRMSVAHAADQTTAAKITLPIAKTSPISGSQMYGSYCAPCHGVNGKGQGPVGTALKTPPMDLTALARNNGGNYPAAHVVTVLEFGSHIRTHSATTMPAWGPLLGKMDKANPEQRMLRIFNLSRYVESMQAR